VAKARNNTRTTDGLTKVKTTDFGNVQTPADINAANAKHYKRGA
jgi:hypothetical protein